MVEHDAAHVCIEHGGGERRRVGVDRQRAEVLDDHEVGAIEDGGQLAGCGHGVVGRVDGQEGERDVVSSVFVVELARDPPHRESQLVQCPLPLAGLDGHTVGATEPVRELDGSR